jgi:ankyrin repeat protein
VDVQDRQGSTPLIEACRVGFQGIASLLVHHGANVKLADKLGRTPLLFACKHGYKCLIELMLNKGADINAKDSFENTPILFACENKNLELIEFLIQNGAQVNVSNDSFKNPLIVSIRNGNLAIVEFLVQHGADISKCHKDGTRALDIAFDYNLTDMCEFLRNRLILGLYETFRLSDLATLRQQVIESIDSPSLFFINSDHVRAFESIDPNDISTDLEKLMKNNVLQFFVSFEFNEKVNESITNNLINQKEILITGETLLYQHFPQLKRNAQEIRNEKLPLTFAKLKELISENRLMTLVEFESDEVNETYKAAVLYATIESFIDLINSFLRTTNEFLDATQRMSTFICF